MGNKIDHNINELSEILATALATRPDLLAKIKTHKGAGESKPVPGKRITMEQRKSNIRERFYAMSAKTAVVLLAVFLSSSCAPKPSAPNYPVRSVAKLHGNAYLVTTDSFKVVKIVRGVGPYHPDSVTKKGYIQ